MNFTDPIDPQGGQTVDPHMEAIDPIKQTPLYKQYQALRDEIDAQRTAFNTHAISLSTLKKWTTAHIDIAAINALDDAFQEIKDKLAIALCDVAMLVWEKHSGKADCQFYMNLATSIRGLSIGTQYILSDNKARMDEVDTTQQQLPVGLITFGVIVLIVLYLVLSKTPQQHKVEDSFPAKVEVGVSPISISTIDDSAAMAANKEENKLLEDKNKLLEDKIKAAANHSLLKVINKLDQSAMFVLYPEQREPNSLPPSVYINAHSEDSLTRIPSGMFAFKIVTGDREAFRNDMHLYEKPQYHKMDTLIFIENNKSYTRVTIWLEDDGLHGRGYLIHEELDDKRK